MRIVQRVHPQIGMSTLPRHLLQAYAQTHYRVDAATPFTLRIGVASAALLALHRRHGVACSAFITAANPRSQASDATTNADRLQRLRAHVNALGLPCIDGVGQHPSNGWPAEASLLVLGLDLDTARRLGERWDQNAIVWSGADAAPQLILLR